MERVGSAVLHKAEAHEAWFSCQEHDYHKYQLKEVWNPVEHNEPDVGKKCCPSSFAIKSLAGTLM